MTCHIKQLLSLSLFALGIFFSNAAQAQVCTPTIYLFRHAEDGANGLTNVGMRHAKLYPMMITHLQTVFHFCPVQRVFAMWNRDTGTEIRGTTNPYYTALPLAQSLFGESAKPEMSFTDSQMNEYQLCEYPIDDKCSGTVPGYTNNGLANGSLFSYLIAYFQTHLTSSVAIFYTSQGMNPVSNVLGVPPVLANCKGFGCTGETLPPTTACPLPVSEPTTNKPCYNDADRILSPENSSG
jgi:hypothetical protein